MATKLQKAYEAVNDAWPDSRHGLPAMTAGEMERAARRLWRFSMGERFTGTIEWTSGNRRIWVGPYKMTLNPDAGWHRFVHDFSHDVVERCNPGEGHSRFHASFERKLVGEVVKRGWLDGRLKDKPKPEAAPPSADQLRQAKLDRLRARADAWEKKRVRAERALAKIARQIRGTQRALAKPKAVAAPAVPTPAAPRLGPWARAYAKAQGLGLTIDGEGGGGWWIYRAGDTDSNRDWSQFAASFSEVCQVLREYQSRQLAA